MKRRNDNHSPGPVIRELVPSSHQRSELGWNDWNKYKQARNKVNNLIKHAKANFYNNLEISISDFCNNDKNFLASTCSSSLRKK